MKGKIFNAQEVQSLISGNKTQFREVIKPQPPLGCHYTINGNQSHALCFADCKTPRDKRDYSKEPLVCVPPKPASIDHRLECPYQVGQKIFCKESFGFMVIDNPFTGYILDEWTAYKADLLIRDTDCKWKPAQHMKQEHSRLTLQIKEIRVERLSEISEEDAIAEGVPKIGFHDLLNREESNGFLSRISGKKYQYYPQEFRKLWNATHKKPEEKFEANPWVWKIEFEIINN